MKTRVTLSIAALVALGFGTALLTAQDREGKAGEYGATPGKMEAMRTTKAVKMTVENKSGKEVVFVSWRSFGPEYHYAVRLKDGEKKTVNNFAAEWRVSGVWDKDGKSEAGWGQSYNFDKDTTVTIDKDKLDIK